MLLADPLDEPVLLAERTAIVLLDPQRHAAVVERVIALPPYHDTVILTIVRLALEAGIHDVDTANGTRVTVHVPGPHRNCVPFLQRKQLSPTRRRLRLFHISPVDGVLLFSHSVESSFCFRRQRSRSRKGGQRSAQRRSGTAVSSIFLFLCHTVCLVRDPVRIYRRCKHRTQHLDPRI